MYKETYSVFISKQYLNFSSAHFLVFDDGSREALHGHNYRVECEIEGTLDGADLYLDFREVKPVIKKICDELDHLVMLASENKHLKVEEDGDVVRATCSRGDKWVLPKSDVCILPLSNITAELLAKYIAEKTIDALTGLYGDVIVEKLLFSVEESPGQAAIYRREYPEGVPLRDSLK